MGLENADFISEMVDTNPLGTDPKSEGDDHLQLIKRCVQNSFPSFVGTQAAPAAVTLTEDEINDAGLQSRVNTWSATQVYSISPRTNNNVAYNSRNVANTASIELLKYNTGDQVEIGNLTSILRQTCASEIQFRVANATVGNALPIDQGGLAVRDRTNASKRVGFRNPTLAGSTITQDMLQEWEGQVIQWDSGDLTAGALQALTTITFLTTANLVLLQGGGRTVTAYLGGSTITGNLSIATGSVIQVWWATATSISVWGNGIS